MEPKNNIEQNFSILSSLLYLKKELKSAGFEQAEALISGAYYAFFEDLKSQNILGDDINEIKTIVETIEHMPANELKKIIGILELYETYNHPQARKKLN